VGVATMTSISTLVIPALLLIGWAVAKPASGDVASLEMRMIPWERALYRATAPAPFGRVEVEVELEPEYQSIVSVSVWVEGRRIAFDKSLLTGLRMVRGEPELVIEDAALDAMGTPRYISLSFQYGDLRSIDLCDQDYEPPDGLPCIVELPRLVRFDVFASGEVRRRLEPMVAPENRAPE